MSITQNLILAGLTDKLRELGELMEEQNELLAEIRDAITTASPPPPPPDPQPARPHRRN